MRLVTTIADCRAALRTLRASVTATVTDPRIVNNGATVGLVPTMGALHAGHLSLVAAARARCPIVVATIFVNPLQFGPNEDLAKYPRTFDDDRELLERAGVDLLFAPSPDEITPASATTVVEVPGIGDRLDGASRPGHFRGVSTIVTKLFNITQPDLAFFGQKDAAQVAVLRAMTRDLNLPATLVVCPTVRDPDGLALSSRNRYLSPADRATALALSAALRSTAGLAQTTTDAPTLEHHLRSTLAANLALRLDYAAVVDPDTLLPLTSTTNGALLAVAAWLGTTRLIDNHLLTPASASLDDDPASGTNPDRTLAGATHG